MIYQAVTVCERAATLASDNLVTQADLQRASGIRVYGQFCIETLHERRKRNRTFSGLFVRISQYRKSKNELFEMSYILIYLCSLYLIWPSQFLE